jgi:hypothetical protein
MLGQLLYLEAKGRRYAFYRIDCFLDDEIHGLFGIHDLSWQSVYHFTMGGAVDDRRLSTLPPYEFQP